MDTAIRREQKYRDKRKQPSYSLQSSMLGFPVRPPAYSTRSSPPQSAGSESKIVSESVHGCPHGSRNEHWRSPYMVIRGFSENTSTGCLGASKEFVDPRDTKGDGLRLGALRLHQLSGASGFPGIIGS